MSGRVDEGAREREEAEGKGRRTERGQGKRGTPGRPEGAPGRPQGGPTDTPGDPTRPQELPRDPSIL